MLTAADADCCCCQMSPALKLQAEQRHADVQPILCLAKVCCSGICINLCLDLQPRQTSHSQYSQHVITMLLPAVLISPLHRTQPVAWQPGYAEVANHDRLRHGHAICASTCRDSSRASAAAYTSGISKLRGCLQCMICCQNLCRQVIVNHCIASANRTGSALQDAALFNGR